MTQTAFAQLASATRQTQSNYEKGERNPDSVYLAAIAAAGADVQYILTGARVGGHPPGPAPPLTPREAALLDNYRHSSAVAQDAMDRTCAALAQPATDVKAG